MTRTTDELRARLEDGLASLIEDREQKVKAIDDEIASVRAAIKALAPREFAKASHRASPKAMAKLADAPNDSASHSGSSTEEPRAPQATATATTTPTEVVPAGKLVAVLSASEGKSTRELARETGGASRQLLALLKELEAEGKVRRTGGRASTRWRATRASK